MLTISEKTYWPKAESAVKAYARRDFANYFSEDAPDDITAVVVTSISVYENIFGVGTVYFSFANPAGFD